MAGFRNDDVQIFGWFDTATGIGRLPVPADVDAHLRSQVVRADGRRGVVAEGIMQLTWLAEGPVVDLTGSQWCALGDDGALESCVQEPLTMTYVATILSDYEGSGCPEEASLPQDPEALCLGRDSPARCVGAPEPPPED
ncbi:MAG: hypothetical protein H6737_06225 [Alphaproteobacteria bacterium]|nr:hypothetical protein [Alphaproteobacteria bacterium]